ncbi:VOC family protein [Nonomuraea sp. LPB2021202275-12-8]|uniref:VOC family protein n=1 Tax=Nonomuraea sp. LPB2021202275-12-8 TaxID=3120159 RepID=UPI00300D0FFA
MTATSDTTVATLGLNHVNLVVADVERSVRFYQQALGMTLDNRTNEITFMTTPGVSDLLALQQAGGDLDRASGKRRSPGDSGGIDHIGFDVADAATLSNLVTAVRAAGGDLLMMLTDSDGHPIAFVSDPDGYVLQLSALAS